MRKFAGVARVLAVLVRAAGVMVAQGPPGRDRDNPPPGHGGVPPGQAKKWDRDGGMPPGQAKKYGYDDDRRMPPGQARKYGEDGRWMPPGQARRYADFRFRDEDRRHFYGYYHRDAERWRGHRRPVFVPGEYIERTYVVQPVPQAYWVNVAPPPPPGYWYGYYQGYVVAYDPTTRIIADVVDLVAAAAGR